MMKGFENCKGPIWAWPRIHVIDDHTYERSEKNLFSNFQNFLLPMERASHDKKIIIKHYLFSSYQSGDTATQRLCCCCCNKRQRRISPSFSDLARTVMFRSHSKLMDSESVVMIKQVKMIYLQSKQCFVDLSGTFCQNVTAPNRKSETSNPLLSVLDNVASVLHVVVSSSPL